MALIKRILRNRKGDTFVFIIILVFFILTLSAILIEYFRMESLYQQVEYVLQRGVNSAVEYAMRDEYRRDGYALLDTAVAEERLYEYLHESMALDSGLNKYAGDEWVYELEIESIYATETPPRLTVDGALRTRSIFSFLTGEVRLPFSISSVNTQTKEGGSE
ncbi:hypothetical protein L7E55_16365 [Pelotomaculum isophthalicicum JI]|uniref:Uncharacterized protein n=1 Tax=Pelotomaculum isophthalicicum JI TaxID=947010 RepID=A0A9X4H3W5_9FIRM|nr:hypothetical protein [Pelotomaculum isophthalicicum]MDF9409900.1 hypothetical protein [Pelotomaculum isophthalicicum JI]